MCDCGAIDGGFSEIRPYSEIDSRRLTAKWFTAAGGGTSAMTAGLLGVLAGIAALPAAASQPPPPLPVLEAREFGPTSLPATYGSAYLSNGVIGLRVGPNPLMQNSTRGMVGGGNALLGGWNWRSNAGGQTPAPAVYPLETSVTVDGLSMAAHPEMVTVVSQRLDTANGELTTELTFRSVALSVVVFLSRATPTVVAMQITAKIPPESTVDIRPALTLPDLGPYTSLPVPQVLDTLGSWVNRTHPWPWQQGIFGIEDLLVLQHR